MVSCVFRYIGWGRLPAVKVAHWRNPHAAPWSVAPMLCPSGWVPVRSYTLVVTNLSDSFPVFCSSGGGRRSLVSSLRYTSFSSRSWLPVCFLCCYVGFGLSVDVSSSMQPPACPRRRPLLSLFTGWAVLPELILTFRSEGVPLRFSGFPGVPSGLSAFGGCRHRGCSASGVLGSQPSVWGHVPLSTFICTFHVVKS